MTRVAAVVLAAGSSSRMRGRHKLLLDMGGVPMIRRSVLAVLGSRVSEAVVVVGHREAEVREGALGPRRRFRDECFIRTRPRELTCSRDSAISPDIDGALVCLGDMPFVGPSDIDAIVAGFDGALGRSIVVPIRGDRRGNPVLWPRVFFPVLRALEGDKGARDLLASSSESILRIRLENDGVLRDLDTPEDLAENELWMHAPR